MNLSEKKHYFYIVLFCLFAAFLIIIVNQYKYDKSSTLGIPTNTDAQNLQLNNRFVSGVVPHHLVAESIINDFFKELSKFNEPSTIILFSPDHFQCANLNETSSIITTESQTTVFNDLKINTDLLANLSADNSFYFNDNCIKLDHGITALLPFVRQYLEDVSIVPLLIPYDISENEIINLVETINQNQSEKIFILASVDFSHYLPKMVADLHDIKSIRTLLNFETQELQSTDVDCWQCLYAARLYAQMQKSEKPNIIDHNNSANLAKIPNSSETTSYFSVIFQKGEMPQTAYHKQQSMLFLGDIMLDRGVEALMKANSLEYPWINIKLLFKGLDVTLANLEGPIVKNPTHFPSGPSDLYLFAFDEQNIEKLIAVDINMLGLANNHTLNMGNSGLMESRQLLNQNNIETVGDPLICTSEYSVSKNDIAYLAFNMTYPIKCTDQEIINTVGEVKQNINKKIIVFIHWGQEYQPKNNASQQNLAHQIIDAGADLIIGHHPHVVQNIELYKNKLIFYSLGNFIFDQYFSDEVQQGLVVGLALSQNQEDFYLYPIISQKSQPALMNQSQAESFLIRLAEKSSSQLTGQIINGIITIGGNKYE